MSEPQRRKCPACGNWHDSGPGSAGLFCSPRCQMSDLYGWLHGEYVISEPLRPDHLAEFEEMTGDDLDRPERSDTED